MRPPLATNLSWRKLLSLCAQLPHPKELSPLVTKLSPHSTTGCYQYQQIRSHRAINIVDTHSDGKGKKLSKEEMEARQRALMAKNLPKRKPIAGVKKVILVASGKGGVGKSTVAGLINYLTSYYQSVQSLDEKVLKDFWGTFILANLAVGTKSLYPSKDISLLDADVFGPSLPRMMNLSGEPDLTKGDLMVPLQNYGVKCMSMGFLVKDSAPVVWRGLMVMAAIEKLIRGVEWSPSDILFVDMPPGTGDTQLSFAQTVEIDGAIIITTPQQVAMQDAVKGVEMFRKTNVPVLGCVLNMSSYICPSCGTETKISQKSQSFAEKTNTNLLGEIPFDIRISDASDDGRPIVISDPKSPQAVKFKSIVEKLIEQLETDEPKK